MDSGAAPGKDTRWQDVAQLKPQTTTKEEVAARTKQHKKVHGPGSDSRHARSRSPDDHARRRRSYGRARQPPASAEPPPTTRPPPPIKQ